jgi:alanine racemase
MIKFSQLEKITGGTNLLFADDREISTLCVDSRKVTEDGETLFFAIKGDRNDGHDYFRSLYKMGVRQFVVERSPTDLTLFAGANIILVRSSIEALQAIANLSSKSIFNSRDRDHRKQWKNNRKGMVISDSVYGPVCG